MASPLLQLPPELSRLCATPSEQPADALSLGLSGLDEVLPDGGLPRGSVIELGAPAGLAQATRVALAACASAQSHSRERRRDGRSSWCAWIDPFSSLYAPGVVAAGVDLDRLLVARPPIEELARIAVRVVASSIFSVVVVDRSGIDGALLSHTSHLSRTGLLSRTGRSSVGSHRSGIDGALSRTNRSSAGSPARNQARPKTPWRTVTRRLALAADNSCTTVLLLSSVRAAQRDRLPTALRLELTRPQPDALSVRVAKERRGRTREAQLLSLRPIAKATSPRLNSTSHNSSPQHSSPHLDNSPRDSALDSSPQHSSPHLDNSLHDDASRDSSPHHSSPHLDNSPHGDTSRDSSPHDSTPRLSKASAHPQLVMLDPSAAGTLATSTIAASTIATSTVAASA